MKKILLITLLIPLLGFSQKKEEKNIVGVGISAGYSSIKESVGEGFIAIKLSEHLILTPFSMKIFSHSSAIRVPVIIEPRIAFKKAGIELYTGPSYQMSGSNGKRDVFPHRGFKIGAGVILHPYKSVIISAGVSGKIYTLTAGLFKFG